MRGGAASARWGSAGMTPRSLSTGSSPRGESELATEDGEELVEVTLDLQDDDTIVLRSVEPAAARGELVAVADGGASSSPSRSPSIRRTSSYRLLQFSQELKAEAVARAHQFSQDLTRRFIRSDDPPPPASRIESALAARAARRQRE